MRKKRRIYNFLIFSMCILVFLVILLICKEEGLYRKSETVSKTKNNIENNLVQSDMEELEKQEETSKKEENNIESNILGNDENEICEIQQDESKVEKIDIYSLIVNKANANSNFVDNIVWQINLIPNNIIETFVERQYIICITNENLKNKLTLVQGETLYDNIKIIGFLDRTDEILYIYYDGITTNNTYTVIHEFGHFADYFVYGNPSATGEFEEIYNNEYEVIQTQTDINVNNERELFAETFKSVILQKNDNTSAYKFVQDCIENSDT